MDGALVSSRFGSFGTVTARAATIGVEDRFDFQRYDAAASVVFPDALFPCVHAEPCGVGGPCVACAGRVFVSSSCRRPVRPNLNDSRVLLRATGARRRALHGLEKRARRKAKANATAQNTNLFTGCFDLRHVHEKRSQYTR